MDASNHLIGRQRFEISVRNKEDAKEIYQVLSDLTRHELGDTLSILFDRLAPGEEILRIDQLVIDVGTVRRAELKSAILKACTGRLLELLESKAQEAQLEAALQDGEKPHQGHLEAIQQFLRQGTWPWWHTTPLKDVVEHLLKEAPSDFIQLLRDLGPDLKSFRRMYLQVPEPLLRELASQVWDTRPKEIRDSLAGLLMESKENRRILDKIIDDRSWWIASLYFQWHGKKLSRSESDAIALIIQAIEEEGDKSEKNITEEGVLEERPETTVEPRPVLPDEKSEKGLSSSDPMDDSPSSLIPAEWTIIRDFLAKGRWPSEISYSKLSFLEKWLSRRVSLAGQVWRNSLKGVLAEETARRRLVANFSDATVEAVIELLSSPEDIKLRQQWEQLLGHKSWQIFSDRRISRAFSLFFLEKVISPKSLPEKEVFERLPLLLGVSKDLFARLMAQVLEEEKEWPFSIVDLREEALKRINKDLTGEEEVEDTGYDDLTAAEIEEDTPEYKLIDIRRYLLHGILPEKNKTGDLTGLSAWMVGLAEKGGMALREFFLDLLQKEGARLRLVTRFSQQVRTAIGVLLWGEEAAFPPAWYSRLLELFDAEGVGAYSRVEFLEALDLLWLENLPDKIAWKYPGLLHALARLLGDRPEHLAAHLLYSLAQRPELQIRVQEVWEIWAADQKEEEKASPQEEDPQERAEEVMESIWYFLEHGAFPEEGFSLKEGEPLFFERMEATPLEVLGTLERVARKINLPERLVTHFRPATLDRILALGLSIETTSGEQLWQEWASWYESQFPSGMIEGGMREEALRILFGREEDYREVTPFFRKLLERLAAIEKRPYREYLEELWETASIAEETPQLVGLLEKLRATLSAAQVETLRDNLLRLKSQDQDAGRAGGKLVSLRDQFYQLALHQEEAWWMSSQKKLDQQVQRILADRPVELLDLLAAYWPDQAFRKMLLERLPPQTFQQLESASSGDYQSLVEVYRESLRELLDSGALGDHPPALQEQIGEELWGELIQRSVISSARMLQALNARVAPRLKIEEKNLLTLLYERAREGIGREDIRYYRFGRLLAEEISLQMEQESTQRRQEKISKWKQRLISGADSELDRIVSESLQTDPAQLLYALEETDDLPALVDRLARLLTSPTFQALLSLKHRALGRFWSLLEKSADQVASTGRRKGTGPWREEGRVAILHHVFTHKEFMPEALVKGYLQVLSSSWNHSVADLAESLLKEMQGPRQAGGLLLRKSLEGLTPTPDQKGEESLTLADEIKRDTQIIRHFLRYGSLPFGVQMSLSAMDSLQRAWITDYPSLAIEFYRSLLDQVQAIMRLIEKFDERLWLAVVRLLLPRQFTPLRELWVELSALLPGLLARYREKEQRHIFFQRVLISLGEQRSSSFQAGRFLFAWLSTVGATERLTAQQILEQIKIRLQEEARETFPRLRAWLPELESALQKQEKLEHESQDMTDSLDKSLFIQNAGLVILAPFLPRYFEMLGMLDGKDFKTQEARTRATLLLQFLVSSETEAPEHLLALNKIICGLPLDVPVPLAITLSEEELEVSDQLLNAVLTNWEKMKNSSVENLRASFLLRGGRLLEGDDFWSMVVEVKAYDIILEFLPWTISMVKLPWMSKRIEVKWKTRT